MDEMDPILILSIPPDHVHPVNPYEVLL